MLVEVLVALVVLVILAGVVLECQVLALKMENGARVARLLRGEIGRVTVVDHLGPAAAEGRPVVACTATWSTVMIEGPEGEPEPLRQCRISSPDRPSLQSVLYAFPVETTP